VTRSGQYLTFRLDAQEYAIDILCVQEIRSFEEPTRMVNSPSFIKGVINLRGVIVPIADLRLKLQVSVADYTEFTVVIIVNIHGTVLGAVVDAVSDVVTIDSDSIRPAPQFESVIDARFILGLVKIEERTLILMNLDALMANAEMGISG
jgi:purine-binding chemotaxis protein CheW